ncbi:MULTISPECIES: hypothetical protein [unclassified Lysinibacillus]|uniref:hypothetical protein n=1 Tax=unclassified Lysinibacillus TaxID=2636778 RepID=UPI0025527510|nr:MULTISPECIES: hypothetical protein [unclassified Lysinibacillus]MDM5247629.1 hypothetical protein [Lysinibacillus sp. G4S2]
MNYESKTIKLAMDDGKIVEGMMKLYEESPDDEEMVLIELLLLGDTISFKHENFFLALQSLRHHLEDKHIQVMCNGAALNVYPSTMQLSMVTGRLAYKVKWGEQAKLKDVVDIFEFDNSLRFVKIEEQFSYYIRWLKSLKG